MQIDSLHVENFKSIREVDVEFSDLNVFVGQNAAGKSNLFEVFQFLRDVKEDDVDDAVQLQGGVEYLRNKLIGDKQNLVINVRIKGDKEFRDSEEIPLSVKVENRKIEKKLKFSKNEFKIIDDNYIKENKVKHTGSGYEKARDVETTRSFSGRVPVVTHVVDDISETKYNSLPEEELFVNNNTGIELVQKFPTSVTGEEPQFGSTYDIEPKRVQGGTTLKGKTELESDGSNLALVIRNIVEDDEQREKFVSLVSDVLPFVADSDVETMPDQSLFLKILEEFEPGEDQYIPASMLSDGTLRVLATIVLLYFSDEEILFIEEPGRNVHPSLIANLMAKVRDVAENTDKQIFVTTHNVEVLKHTPLESIRLVSRGDEGFTQVEKPAENERVQTFLENDIGIEELYTENLLGE